MIYSLNKIIQMFFVTDTQCVLYDLYIIQASCFKELKAVHYYFMCACLFQLMHVFISGVHKSCEPRRRGDYS